MSDEGRAWCLAHSPFRGTQFFVHYLMCDLANDTHDNLLWVGDAALAQKARVATKTVQRVRDELIKMGLLEVVDASTGPGRHAVYRLLMPTGTVDTESSVARGNGGHRVHRTVDTESSVRSLYCSIETEKEQKGQRDAQYASQFDDFWDAYPRRVEKTRARNNWLKLVRAGEDPDAILAAAAAYASQCRQADTPEQFTKKPANFLGRDDVWRDYLPSAESIAAAQAQADAERVYGYWVQWDKSSVGGDGGWRDDRDVWHRVSPEAMSFPRAKDADGHPITPDGKRYHISDSGHHVPL